ncbi:glycoside hydrolase family 20 zincin-like fold domain-containing protein [Cohnella hongkongensis]|uniref:beta-N-acetylhexosaminidase n=1 Tax=Cohnella hongkongensis TaxID=178337 RepID=A0ABV9FJ74_9BACL
MTLPVILPHPLRYERGEGTFALAEGDGIRITLRDRDELFDTAGRLQEIVQEACNLKLSILVEHSGMLKDTIRFERTAGLAHEAYRIGIDADRIRIEYGSGTGAFHAVSTLKQLFVQCGKTLPCLTIEDAPDYRARGVMLDISRNKIPTMETLYAFVDKMADLKMNELQLYIEGFSFAYPSYPAVWLDGTPITGEEIVSLDRYCKQRHIDLVPNQNSFGHMGDWLAKKEFQALAERPEGYEFDWQPGVRHRADTLDPTDPGSLALVGRMTADLLPYFSSPFFNVGCDETELGGGKSKEACEARGKGQVYLDYLLAVYDIVKAHGKRMMFWGDIIIKSPELIDRLPRDVIALEWGYEANHRFKEDGARFREVGIDFYVCPGTSSWCSITGRTDNMKANLLNAAASGKQHGAAGYLITDWGDNGHWQYPLFSDPGFVYGAALSWGVERNADADVAGYLDRYVFQDKSGRMGKLVMNLGNYYLLEKGGRDNGTAIARTLFAELDDDSVAEGFSLSDYDAIERCLLDLEDELKLVRMEGDLAGLIEAETRHAIRFLLHGCELGKLKLLHREGAEADALALAERLSDDIAYVIRRHEQLWLERNRHGGLTDSVKRLRRLQESYERLCGRGSAP